MIIKGKKCVFFAILFILTIISCKKEVIEGEKIGNNDAPYYDGIPTVLVQNYVNRLFIDLIGREPLDIEMEEEVAKLKNSNYSMIARDSLIIMLMEDETFRVGDSSYKAAYYIRLYELFKVKILEGASDGDVNRERGMIYSNLRRDSMAGDWYNLALNWEKINKLDAVLAIDEDYRDDKIEIKEVFARLLDNMVYDRINMNTFNFVNASFNDLFDRYPSPVEFDNAFEVVEYDRPAIILGESAANKGDYIQVLVNSREFYEGMVRWSYGTLMARQPTSTELEVEMNILYFDHDLQRLQLSILKTDEYANFNQ